jgi:hypothetical protein
MIQRDAIRCLSRSSLSGSFPLSYRTTMLRNGVMGRVYWSELFVRQQPVNRLTYYRNKEGPGPVHQGGNMRNATINATPPMDHTSRNHEHPTLLASSHLSRGHCSRSVATGSICYLTVALLKLAPSVTPQLNIQAQISPHPSIRLEKPILT